MLTTNAHFVNNLISTLKETPVAATVQKEVPSGIRSSKPGVFIV